MSPEDAVGRENRDVFQLRVGDEQPVEWIPLVLEGSRRATRDGGVPEAG